VGSVIIFVRVTRSAFADCPNLHFKFETAVLKRVENIENFHVLLPRGKEQKWLITFSSAVRLNACPYLVRYIPYETKNVAVLLGVKSMVLLFKLDTKLIFVPPRAVVGIAQILFLEVQLPGLYILGVRRRTV